MQVTLQEVVIKHKEKSATRTAKLWARLPRNNSVLPSLEILETTLDAAPCSNGICTKQEVGPHEPWCPFQHTGFSMLLIDMILYDTHTGSGNGTHRNVHSLSWLGRAHSLSPSPPPPISAFHAKKPSQSSVSN